MIKNYDSRNMKWEIKVMGLGRRFSFNRTVGISLHIEWVVRICVSNAIFTTLIFVCIVCYHGLNRNET